MSEHKAEGGDYCEACGALVEPDGMIRACRYCQGIVCIECCEEEHEPSAGSPPAERAE